jgi:hypothetical protein
MRYTDPAGPVGPGYPAYIPVPTRKRRKVWPWVLIGLTVLALCIGGSVLVAAAGSDGKPNVDVTVTDPGMGNTGPGDKTTPATKVPAKAVTISDGTWAVNSEIKPGTYTATVPGGLFDLCGWFVRTSDSPEDVRDFGSGNEGDRMRVTIKKTDVEFESTGCGTWTAVK